jgi:hypothetical protein
MVPVRGWVVVVVVVLALTGCVQTSDDTSPGSLRDLVVSPDGIRGLPIDQPIVSSDLVAYGTRACPSRGGWLPRYPQDTLNSSGQALNPFDVVTEGSARAGKVVDEYVWSKLIATSKGIRVGSTLAAVRSAYPGATITNAYSTVVYAVAGAHGTLLIEVAGHNDDAVGEWPAKTLDTVVWMHVQLPHAKIASIAGGNDAGPCPVAGKDPGDTDDD